MGKSSSKVIQKIKVNDTKYVSVITRLNESRQMIYKFLLSSIKIWVVP